MGKLTQDLFTCIALLNSLSDFLHLRSLITQDLSESTASAPYTSTRLFTLLENEQWIISSDQKRHDAIALASQITPAKRTTTLCSNCKKPGHSVGYCVAPGGGMAGKTIDEAKDAQKREKDAKRRQNGTGGSATGRFPVNIKGADGKIYAAYMDAPLPEEPAFAAIVDHEAMPSVPADTVEYLGWIVIEDDLKISVDWTKTQNGALMAQQVTPEHMSISCDDKPFWLDTGTTVHISPDKRDFYSLRKVAPRTV
jgi:hypothetical protein